MVKEPKGFHYPINGVDHCLDGWLLSFAWPKAEIGFIKQK
jgi:hypothetical protein